MNYAAQRRQVTQSTSKLSKVKLVEKLQKPEAWHSLAAETRMKLYALLPAPREGEPQHDIDVHPLLTKYREHIERAVLQWQDDLKNGRETKKFREHKIVTVGSDLPLEEDEEDEASSVKSEGSEDDAKS